jgi:hypothetical protein
MPRRYEQDARSREEAEEDVRGERDAPRQYEHETNASVEPQGVATSENFTVADHAADATEVPLSSPR